MKANRIFNLFTLLLILVLFAMPSFAQEATPEPAEAPPVDVVEIPPVEEAAELPIPSAFSTIQFAAPLVVFVVALLKRYLPYSAAAINFYVSLLVYVVYQIAVNNGMGLQFEAATLDLASILQSVSNLFIGVGGTFLASAGIYHASDKANLPLINYKRPTIQAAKDM